MSDASPYLIEVPGCDATTKVIVHLTESQLIVAREIAFEVTDAGGGCHPTMNIHEVVEASSEQYCDFYDHLTQLSYDIK